MGMPPMNRPPMGGDMGGAPQPGGGGGGMDFAASLQELHQSLPPEVQSKLDPSNPITQLLFKRLRDGISEEEGQALLMLFGNADAMALAAMKKFLPEIIVLLDIFDDGEINDSVGEVDGGSVPAPGGANAPPPRPRPETAQAAPKPGYEDDDEDEEDYGGGAGSLSRLSQVRA